MKIEKKVLDMSLAGIFTAVIIAMSVVPFLGYIPLGFMNATIIHVPVIIGALLLGPKYGAYLGLVFGITSLVRATLTPTVTSFVFSPFVTIGGYSGNMLSVVISIVPRVLIGVFPGPDADNPAPLFSCWGRSSGPASVLCPCCGRRKSR